MLHRESGRQKVRCKFCMCVLNTRILTVNIFTIRHHHVSGKMSLDNVQFLLLSHVGWDNVLSFC